MNANIKILLDSAAEYDCRREERLTCAGEPLYFVSYFFPPNRNHPPLHLPNIYCLKTCIYFYSSEKTPGRSHY